MIAVDTADDHRSFFQVGGVGFSCCIKIADTAIRQTICARRNK
jgi:hypothetical protein